MSQNKKITDLFIAKVVEGMKAIEKEDLEESKKLFEEALEIFDKLEEVRADVAEGRKIAFETLEKINFEISSENINDANENSQEFKFKDFWQWFCDVTLKLGLIYELDDHNRLEFKGDLEMHDEDV